MLRWGVPMQGISNKTGGKEDRWRLLHRMNSGSLTYTPYIYVHQGTTYYIGLSYKLLHVTLRLTAYREMWVTGCSFISF